MEISIKFSPPLEDKAASWRKLAETGIYESIGRLAQEADAVLFTALAEEMPVRTGAYVQTLRSVQHGGVGHVSFDYRAAEPLSTWIIRGTAPHSIDAAPGHYLHFLGSDGQYHFAKHVNHPGTKPNDFPTRAWANARSEVLDILSRTGRQIIDEVK